VPKTSSGKIRRAACSELYQQGLIGKTQRAVWWQMMRLVMAGLKPRLRRSWRRLSELSYASYSWTMFTLIAPLTWLLVALCPRKDWCWSIARAAGRLLSRLLATHLSVEGLENVPRNSPCILVANHSSYLDGLVLACTLPIKCSFVAKSELAESFIPRVFLSRLRTEFVERLDMQKGVTDARRIAKAATAGRTLMFFPEGTIYRMPGLQCFHMGAFVAAADAGLPVVPITIRGTRSKLRANCWFPRRGAVSVSISQPIWPEGEGWAAAVKLRDEVKAEILRHCGEPDLAQTPTIL
jgi:1-acyl-sn-glycerol-3-phosphate acyltransferase